MFNEGYKKIGYPIHILALCHRIPYKMVYKKKYLISPIPDRYSRIIPNGSLKGILSPLQQL